MGVKKIQSCGGAPLFAQAVAATLSLAGTPAIEVGWNDSADELGGEKDVIRYVIWRQVASAPGWGDPYASVPSGGSPYLFADTDLAPGESYQYAVAAQDCTPTLSPHSVSGWVAIP